MATLKGTNVFITGASSGIGRATAIAFAREGARLLVCARSIAPLEELRQALVGAGAPAGPRAGEGRAEHPTPARSVTAAPPQGCRAAAVRTPRRRLQR